MLVMWVWFRRRRGLVVLVVVLVVCVVVGCLVFVRLFGGGQSQVSVSDVGYRQVGGAYSLVVVGDGDGAVGSLGDVGVSLGITDPGSEFVVSGSASVGDTTFYRLGQVYQGVSVFGRGVVVVATGGVVAGLTSNFLPLTDVDTSLRISQDDAVSAAVRFVSRKYGVKAEMVTAGVVGPAVYSLGVVAPTMTYMVTASGFASLGGFFSVTVFVDNSGQVVASQNNVSYDTVSDQAFDGQVVKPQHIDLDLDGDQYTMRNSVLNMEVFHPADSTSFDASRASDYVPIVWTKGAQTPDADAVDAMVNVATARKFFTDRVGVGYSSGGGLFGQGDDGGAVSVVVGVEPPVAIDQVRATDGFGAFFTPVASGAHVIVVDAAAGGLPSDSADVDVMAHEYTHGVVYDTAGLASDGESGAINEGLADVFGELVENSVTSQMDWLDGGRNMADPTGGSVSQVSAYRAGMDPHDASTIISHVAYLLWNGGVDGSWAPISDLDVMARLWFQGLLLMHSDATFSQCRNAVEMSARIL